VTVQLIKKTREGDDEVVQTLTAGESFGVRLQANVADEIVYVFHFVPRQRKSLRKNKGPILVS